MTDDIKCPICGSNTRLKTAKKDGSKFHVCVNWPECKGKVAFEDEYEDEDDKWKEERTVEKRPRVYHDKDLNKQRISAMEIAWSVITLICGVVVQVGVFLTWLNQEGGIAGWDVTRISIYLTSNTFEGYIVLAGGVLMAVFALSAFCVSLASKGGRAAKVTLGILSIVGALMAIGGGGWFLIDAKINYQFSCVSDSFYISFVAAIIGYISAIWLAVFSKRRKG